MCLRMRVTHAVQARTRFYMGKSLNYRLQRLQDIDKIVKILDAILLDKPFSILWSDFGCGFQKKVVRPLNEIFIQFKRSCLEGMLQIRSSATNEQKQAFVGKAYMLQTQYNSLYIVLITAQCDQSIIYTCPDWLTKVPASEPY